MLEVCTNFQIQIVFIIINQQKIIYPYLNNVVYHLNGVASGCFLYVVNSITRHRQCYKARGKILCATMYLPVYNLTACYTYTYIYVYDLFFFVFVLNKQMCVCFLRELG